ncbi:Protein of unknown function [Lachnospiraceae bacterium KHCPX20]|nr:Protein of unknown function [Lachnospiraceae bacterium KHCPX20]
MKTFKKGIALVMALAVVFCAVPAINAKAAVKLNNTKATIYAGNTLQLKLNGTKKVKWSTSDKKVATVSKKGLVKGVKAGKATITATDVSAKKKYTCKVTVKKSASFGYKKDNFYIFGGGDVIGYEGKLVAGATYYIDGKKQEVELWDDGEEGRSGITFATKFSEGKHTLTITKKGYKDFTWTFTYEAPTFDGVWADDPWISDGTLYVILNPATENLASVSVDGKKVEPKDAFVNGDGVYVIWIDATGLSAGEHTVEVSAEGFGTSSKTVTVE